MVFAFLLQAHAVAKVAFVNAEEYSINENPPKNLCRATVDEKFEENSILMTFTEEASVVNKEYDAKDFSEMFQLDTVSVEDLTRFETDVKRAEKRSFVKFSR